MAPFYSSNTATHTVVQAPAASRDGVSGPTPALLSQNLPRTAARCSACSLKLESTPPFAGLPHLAGMLFPGIYLPDFLTLLKVPSSEVFPGLYMKSKASLWLSISWPRLILLQSNCIPEIRVFLPHAANSIQATTSQPGPEGGGWDRSAWHSFVKDHVLCRTLYRACVTHTVEVPGKLQRDVPLSPFCTFFKFSKEDALVF